MGRQLNDWLSTYLDYTENSEPPKSYHIWVGISLIAGALQRKVYMKWGFDTIYPNMYIVLIGPSGKCRKGTAMNIGKDLIKDIGISITSESITREALIRAMKKAVGNFKESTTGDVKFHCSLTCMSDELSVFLGQKDVRFLADLTDWFDSKDRWKYETKGAGTDDIQGVCFNLLGATAPDWLQSILPQEAVGGGFTSRVIFVVEENKRKTISKHILTDEQQQLRTDLIKDLEKITIMSGEFKFSDNASKLYVDWYEREEEKIRQGKMPVSDPRFAGYCDRRATHIKKISMILSASRSDKLIITEEDFTRAQMLLESVEVNMAKTFGGLGQARYSEVTESVLNYIKRCRVVKRSVLMRQFYRDMDTQTLGIVESVLTQMKVVRISINTENGEATYTYIGEN